jgi:hypothetical protein
MNKKIKSLVATSTILVLLSACANISSSNVNNLTSSIGSLVELNPQQPIVTNQVKLVAVEVDKLPTRINYLSTEVISTSGGVLRVVYSDYRVRYVSMNDVMIEVSRLNTSSVGTSRVTLRYEELGTTLFTSYQINIIPFKVALQKVELDIISSDVAFEQKVNLNYIIYPLNAYYQQVEWSSSNELIARVDSNGVVTPINPGEVLISVKIDNNFTATSKLNILPMQPREIQLNPTFVGLIEQGWIPLATAADLAAIDDPLTSTSRIFAANTSYAVTVENKTSAQMLDLNYFLVNNIDLSSIANWTPLETFTGELDGKGYNIYNLNLVATDASTQGMFSTLNNAVIRNIRLVDFKIKMLLTTNTTRNNYGILAGRIIGQSSIDNLQIIESNEGESYLRAEFGNFTGNRSSGFGAIAGLINGNLTITNTTIDSDLSGLDSTGGFIGDVRNLSQLSITNSKFKGRILKESNAPTVVNIGGLIGSIFSNGTININRVSVESDINMGYQANERNVITVGGIIGLARENTTVAEGGPVITISSTKFIGDLSGVGNVAKFIGSVFNSNTQSIGSITINDSYGIGDIVVNGYGAGHISGFTRLGTTRSLDVSNVFVIGDVTSINVDNTRLGFLFGTNGDNNGGGAGTMTTTDVYYSSDTNYSQNFVRGQMLAGTGLVSMLGTTGLSRLQLRSISNFNTWDFNTIWRINPNINNGYPYLAWEE